MYGLKFIVFLLPLASLKAMASNQQRKKHRSCSGSWPSLSSDESWLIVGSPVAAEFPVTEEGPYSISAVAEEEPPAVSVAAAAEEDPAASVAEDPYSKPPAASLAAVAEEAPAAAVAVAALKMQPCPLQLWRLPVPDAPLGAPLVLEDSAPPPMGLQVFELVYFRSWRLFTGDCSQHNVALKFFRSQQALVKDPFQPPSLEFHRFAPTAVAVINHPKGMAWEFTGEWRLWSWHEMIAQLEDTWMEKVVTGIEGRSRGLVGCSFAIRPGSYDHKRHSMMIKTAQHFKQQLPIWDFVVRREDGSGIRLHPSFKGTVVETIEEPGDAEEWAVTAPPRSGLGRSDGRGTYKKYKNLGILEKMRFDSSKKP